MKKKIVFGILLLFACFALTGCGCSKKEFSVKFDSKGGSSVSSQTVKDGDSATKPADPTRSGYTFAGWFLDLNDDDAFDFSSKISKDITLYAKWSQGESPVGGQCSKTCDDGYTLDSSKCECVKNAASDENVAVSSVKLNKSSLALVVGESSTLKATVSPSNASNKAVTWSSSDSSIASVSSKGVVSAKKVGSATITVKTANGKTASIKVTVSDVKSYTVKFDSAGGSAVASQTVKEGNKVSKPTANPTRAGYTFNGWLLDGKAYDFNSKVTKDITLTASWTEVKATYSIKLTGIVPADGSAIKQYIAAVTDSNGKAVTDYKTFSYNSHTIRNNGEFVRADFVNRSVSTAKLTLADGSVVDVKVSYGDINENDVR